MAAIALFSKRTGHLTYEKVALLISDFLCACIMKRRQIYSVGGCAACSGSKPSWTLWLLTPESEKALGKGGNHEDDTHCDCSTVRAFDCFDARPCPERRRAQSGGIAAGREQYQRHGQASGLQVHRCN